MYMRPEGECNCSVLLVRRGRGIYICRRRAWQEQRPSLSARDAILTTPQAGLKAIALTSRKMSPCRIVSWGHQNSSPPPELADSAVFLMCLIEFHVGLILVFRYASGALSSREPIRF